jgi:AcrR family transcriptional regulator
MGRPTKFSIEQLQQAALDIVDRDGLSGLSMRTLAGALGTGAMTLYNHVSDREGLDVLVVDAVLAQARLPATAFNDWRDQVEALAIEAWRVVRAHPNAIPLILTRRSRSVSTLRFAEALLDGLARSGRSGFDLLVAFRAVTAFVMGFAQAELAGPLAADMGEPAGKVIARMRKLPHDEFPLLVQLAAVADPKKTQNEFRAGLRALLEGLAIKEIV